MPGSLSSEALKYRRTPVLPLVVGSPAGLALLCSWYVSEGDASWDGLLRTVFEVWTMVFIPAGAALLAGITSSLEEGAGRWISLRTRPVHPAELLGGRLVLLSSCTLTSSLLIGMLTGACGLVLKADGKVPWETLLASGFISWLCALPLLFLEVWVAEAWGAGAAAALGIVGVLIASLIGGTPLGGGPGGPWRYVPWAWPARAVSLAISYFGPETPQQAGFPAGGILTHTCVSSLTLAAALAAASLLWFSHSEAK